MTKNFFSIGILHWKKEVKSNKQIKNKRLKTIGDEIVCFSQKIWIQSWVLCGVYNFVRNHEFINGVSKGTKKESLVNYG